MPLNLDSCITGIFVPGNIGASSGQAPVEPVMPARAPGTVVATIVETAHATDLQAFVLAIVTAAVIEAATADAVVAAGFSYAAGVVEAASATETQAGTTIVITGTPVTTGTEYEHGVGSAYAGFTVTASGGIAPYTYSVASGTLPSGITLNSSTGAVSGTPAFESAGIYAGIVIRATDAASATANLASFTLTIAYKDPYYSSTKLLLDHDAADASTTFTDASASARGNGTTVGNTQHDTGVTPPYGSSWFLFDGTTDAIRFSDSNDWNLGTQNFTLDVVVRPSSVTGNRFWICQWDAAPNLNFVFYQFNNEAWFSCSTTGSNNLSDVGATSAIVVNTTYHFRLDFNGTKYRLYKNGTMVASSTTLRSLYTGSVLGLAIGATSSTSSNSYAGHMKGVRITVGVARTASDSGYTISNRALPTS